jgi:tetratricopeptide (TPR) repeat protein
MFSLCPISLGRAPQPKTAPGQGGLIERARQAYLSGHYLMARDLFGEARAAEPRNPQAHYGYARAAHAVHQYGEAIPAYEKAVELSPQDEQVWTDYLNALAWGGIFKSNSKMLMQARDKGLAALAWWPDCASIYKSVEDAVEKLNEGEIYMRSLEAMQERFPHSPVLAIQIKALKYRLAQGKKNQQGMDRIKDALRADLKAIAPDSITSGSLTPAQLYRIANAYRLLGEQEKYEAAFAALQKTPAGRRLASSIFLPYWPGMMSLANADLKKENLKERWQKIRSYLEQNPPTWEVDHQHFVRRMLGMEFDTLAEASRQRYSGDQASGAIANLPEVNLDALIALGERVARMDTTGGAAWLVKTAQLLLDLNLKLEAALRISAAGIKALETRQPGLLYPGDTEPETEASRLGYIARLKIVQGEAREKTGQIALAEKPLREAVKDSPSARSYSTLGRFLLARGKNEEAYDHLVSALAKDPSKGSLLEQQTRAAASQALAALKKSETSLAEDVTARKQELALASDRKLIGERLNQPALAFELMDTAGKTWRLGELKGKIVVVNYWSMYCGWCVAEFPHYQQLVNGYQQDKDVVFLAVSIDSDPSAVKLWLKEKGYEFTVLHDKESSIAYQVNGTPTALVIGPDGKLVYRAVGFTGPEKWIREMRLRIEALRAK